MVDLSLFKEAAHRWGMAGHIVIITHEKPDGDAIASLIALNVIIKTNSPASICLVNKDGVPPVFHFLPGVSDIQSDFIGGDADLIITLDCGDIRRTGFGERLQQLVHHGIPLINIDHHGKNDLHRLATLNIVDQQAASTTHILFNLSVALAIPLNPSLATVLLTGLYTDTGSFQHAVTTPEVLQIAAKLLAHGARLKDLHHHLTQSRPVPMLKLWGITLERMKVYANGLVVSVVTQQDLHKTGATEEDLAGVLTMLEATPVCRVVLLLSELSDGTIKGSLRSNNSRVNVAKIAKVFGGGGHERASGFVFPGTLKVDKKQWNVV